MEEEHHKQDPLRNQGQRRSHLQPQQEPQVEEHTTVACSHRRCRQLGNVSGRILYESCRENKPS